MENYRQKLLKKNVKEKYYKNTDYAIVGIATKVAQYANVFEFWKGLLDGVDSVREMDLVRAELTDSIMCLMNLNSAERDYPAMGYMNDIDCFDNEFFKITPLEAELMSPEQRIFLEVAWNTIVDAGYTKDDINSSKMGIFLGMNNSSIVDYRLLSYMIEPELFGQSAVGNLHSVVASRIAYMLDLRGPAIVVDTACSSSLMALHQACLSIKSGDCEMALVGGVNINIFPSKHNSDGTIGIESSNNRTRAFSEDSDGTGFGEGVACIFIKKLSQAIHDRDHIYCVIKSTGVNQDGASMGLTAPNSEAQQQVVRDTWKKAGINPVNLSFIEAHGTGTRIGDIIEVQSLTSAIRQYTNKSQFCSIGSVKNNIGHLDSAAGIVGVIKAALSLKYGVYPKTINYTYPNIRLNICESPLFVNDYNLTQYKNEMQYCAVNSFGLSGTNCHAVLGSHSKVMKNKVNGEEYHILAISAKSLWSLQKLVEDYYVFCKTCSELDVINFTYTSNSCRDHYTYRLIYLFKDIDECITMLSQSVNDGFDFTNTNMLAFYSDVKTQEQQECIQEKLQKLKQVWRDEYSYKYQKVIKDVMAYLKGKSVDWNDYFRERNPQRISIPGYAFEKKKFWIAPKAMGKKYHALKTKKWCRKERLGNEEREINEGNTLVLHHNTDNVGFLKQLFHTYGSNDARITPIELNDNFEEIYRIISSNMYTHIIYLSKNDHTLFLDNQNIDYSEIENLISVLNVIDNCENVKKITVLVESAHEIIEGDKVCLGNALLEGIVLSFNYESSGTVAQLIDYDCYSRLSKSLYISIVEQSIEIKGLRLGKEYYLKISKLDEVSENNQSTDYKGALIVSGGNGGIGLEVIRHLSKKYSQPIVALGRSKLDNSILKSLSKNIEYFIADITNMNELMPIIQHIEKSYGHIRGVFHLAGNSDAKQIKDLTVTDYANIVDSKVKGTLNLIEATKKFKMELFVTFSSLNSILGGHGLAAYASANGFLDAYCRIRHKNIAKYINIVWGPWGQVGMAKRYGVSKASIVKPISTEEGIRYLEKILHMSEREVIVGEVDNIRFSELECKLPFSYVDSTKKQPNKVNNLDKVANKSNKALVALCFEKSLGIKDIDGDTNFFDLGGNSLSSVNLVTDLNRQFNITLKYNAIEKYSTINELTKHIETIDTTYHERKSDTNLLEGILPFNAFTYKNCFYNSLFSAAQNLGISIPMIIENDIPYYKMKQDFELGISLRSDKSIEEMVRSLGIKCRVNKSDNNILLSIKQAIDKGRPVIIWVDSYYESIRKDTYQTTHHPHSLLVFGYDDFIEEFTIIEHSSIEALDYAPTSIPYKDIVLGYENYEERFLGIENDYSYYEFYRYSSDSNIGLFRSKYYKRLKLQFEDLVLSLKEIDLFRCKLRSAITVDILYMNRMLNGINEIINYKTVEAFLYEELFGESEMLKHQKSIIRGWSIIRIRLLRNMEKKEMVNDDIHNLEDKYNKMSVLEKEKLKILELILE